MIGMRNKKETLRLLQKLFVLNHKNQRAYFRMAVRSDNMQRQILRALGLQKRRFCFWIRKEMEGLQQNKPCPAFSGENQLFLFAEEEFPYPSFRFEQGEVFTTCYLMEKKLIEDYQFLLSKITIPGLRDMLLAQKHALRLNILRMLPPSKKSVLPALPFPKFQRSFSAD